MGHRATFPRSDPRSIIADERLNFCVRNGNRCFPLSINAPKGVEVRQSPARGDYVALRARNDDLDLNCSTMHSELRLKINQDD